MEQLISKMSEFGDMQSAMKSWCMQNSLEQPKILSYQLESISKLYENFVDKYGCQQNFIAQDKNQTQPIWFENELILFQWTVITLSLMRQIYLNDFKNSQIKFLSSIFRHKQNYIIDYEIKCMLVKGKQIRNAWKVDEQQMLSVIIQTTADKNKWNQIARQLYKNSDGKFFRQGKHCRERWFSYMENRKPGKQWNVQADIELLELISAIGKRWSQVANKFTKPQSRLTLRKRFKILLQQASVKLGHDISEREAVSFLLQQKYEKASYSTNKGLPKNEKIAFQVIENKNPTNHKKQSQQEKEFTSRQDERWLGSKDIRLISDEYDQQKVNVVMWPQMAMNMDQNRTEHGQLLFGTGIQMNGNAYNMGYVPIQYYPQAYPIMSSMGVESVNYCMNVNPYPMGGQLMFYL